MKIMVEIKKVNPCVSAGKNHCKRSRNIFIVYILQNVSNFAAPFSSFIAYGNDRKRKDKIDEKFKKHFVEK
ncbi:hypothetical protein MsAm2_03330 [Methanolapillus ohkumae]|uniref:Uncharacterized protein n=1 Tax=Methanolapillus ohkumae TaxID=3028298 RepID=A0AA96VE12_9EURY|nr:hypothetical protein MsAm2_03330 [Methanosarcinaceae archaeon Am2]